MSFRLHFHVQFKGHEYVGHRPRSEARRAKAEGRQLSFEERFRDGLPVKRRPIAEVLLREPRRMVPRATGRLESEFICPGVPYIPQPANSNSCWHAAFNMVNGRDENTCSDYAGDSALYCNNEFQPIPKGRLKDVLNRERLAPVAGCEGSGREFTAPELADLLSAHGPIAFAWRPEYNRFFTKYPSRYHWSVMIDADPARNEIVYHDPVKNRRSHAMSIDEFNRQRSRDHDHTMVRRAGGTESLPKDVIWAERPALPPLRRDSASLVNRFARAVRGRHAPVIPE